LFLYKSPISLSNDEMALGGKDRHRKMKREKQLEERA
jgi:hypothetical protein